MIEKKYIVVVEDEQMVRDLCVTLLERFGYKVTAFSDGKEGLLGIEELYRTGNVPDLILTDIQMPVIDGVRMVEKLTEELADPTMKHKVVFMTGHAGCHSSEQITRLSVYAPLPKPFDINSLRGKMDAVLQYLPFALAAAVPVETAQSA